MSISIAINNNLSYTNISITAGTTAQKITNLVQGGPLPVINGVLSPISRPITPDTHLQGNLYGLFHLIYNW